MCTLTWGYSTDGYHLHFNRDESRLRARGTLPSLQSQNDVSFLAPTDPEAQGTWILCNEYGLSVCLLNNYVDITSIDGIRSRGLLVRDLSCAQTIDEALSRIRAENISHYSPFDAFLFDRTAVCEISWNGQKLALNPMAQQSFKSSSGVDTENVLHGREQQFQTTLKDIPSLRAYHRSHLPSKSSYSVCMHREDARTQSYTEITISKDAATMLYTDGPPCSTPLGNELSLPLTTRS